MKRLWLILILISVFMVSCDDETNEGLVIEQSDNHDLGIIS